METGVGPLLQAYTPGHPPPAKPATSATAAARPHHGPLPLSPRPPRPSTPPPARPAASPAARAPAARTTRTRSPRTPRLRRRAASSTSAPRRRVHCVRAAPRALQCQHRGTGRHGAAARPRAHRNKDSTLCTRTMDPKNKAAPRTVALLAPVAGLEVDEDVHAVGGVVAVDVAAPVAAGAAQAEDHVARQPTEHEAAHLQARASSQGSHVAHKQHARPHAGGGWARAHGRMRQCPLSTHTTCPTSFPPSHTRTHTHTLERLPYTHSHPRNTHTHGRLPALRARRGQSLHVRQGREGRALQGVARAQHRGRLLLGADL